MQADWSELHDWVDAVSVLVRYGDEPFRLVYTVPLGAAKGTSTPERQSLLYSPLATTGCEWQAHS